MQLSPDLTRAVTEPRVLWSAMDYKNVNQEAIKLQNRISMQDKQEEK